MGGNHGHDDHGHGDGHGEMGHVSSPKQLLSVFGALLVLTAITVWISRGPINFGWISLFIAIVVATMKASLVMAFFMHLRYDKPFNAVAFISAYLFLALFLFFALLDSTQYQPDIERWKSANPPADAKVVPPLPAPPVAGPTPTPANAPAEKGGAAAPTPPKGH